MIEFIFIVQLFVYVWPNKPKLVNDYVKQTIVGAQ